MTTKEKRAESLLEMLSDYWYAFQQVLFPRLQTELGPMGERYELLVAVLELVRVHAPANPGAAGTQSGDARSQQPSLNSTI